MLNTLQKEITSRSKRVGRGIGSGKGGHTIGKGTKGHKTRSGYKEPRPGFEGGQMPLSRRLPKLKGFTRGYLKINESNFMVRTLDLNMLDEGVNVDLNLLIEKKLISNKAKTAKIVLKGKLLKKLNFVGIKASKGAKEAIEKLGGSVK